MARQAIGIAVFAEQRETRQVMIEEDVLGPRGFVVAVLANCPLGSLMRIVFFMAVAAACRWRGIKQRFDVATGAFDIRMSAVERVSGFDIVIERELRPIVSDMARFTTLAKVFVMIVVVFVA